MAFVFPDALKPRRLIYLLFLLALGIIPLLAGLGVFGWQVFNYLQSGEWSSVSFLDFLDWWNYRRPWVENPTTWIGLWKFFHWLPASVAGILYGTTMTVIFANADDSA